MNLYFKECSNHDVLLCVSKDNLIYYFMTDGAWVRLCVHHPQLLESQHFASHPPHYLHSSKSLCSLICTLSYPLIRLLTAKFHYFFSFYVILYSWSLQWFLMCDQNKHSSHTQWTVLCSCLHPIICNVFTHNFPKMFLTSRCLSSRGDSWKGRTMKIFWE